MEDDFISTKKMRVFIEYAVVYYSEQNAPSRFIRWLDELYEGSSASPGVIVLDEMLTLRLLWQDGTWEQTPDACKRVYRLFKRSGMDPAGLLVA